MERPGTVLANVENVGKIYRSGDCDNIHLQVGPVSVLLSIEAYVQLVALANTSASNYEASVARPGADGHGHHG
jgi:hypothetical protein